MPDGSSVLYDPRSQLAHALSASASDVWTLCDGSHALPGIAQVLAEAYDAPLARIQADVAALLTVLDTAGLFASPSIDAL